MQAGRAQRLHRQEIAQQRAVGHIDGEGAAGDVGAPRRIIALQHRRRAGSSPDGHRLAHDVGDVGGVAQPHVEALGADRRQHVRGFADQRDAMRGRIDAAARSPAETDGVRLPHGCGREWNATGFRRPPTVRRRSAPSAVRPRLAPPPIPRCSGRRAAARTRRGLAGCEIRWRYCRWGREWLMLKVSAA